MINPKTPLIVDLDGTLIRTDLLLESVLLLLKKNPFYLFLCVFWLLGKGKEGMKHEISQRVMPDMSLIPTEPAVLGFMEKAHTEGRKVFIASASPLLYVEKFSKTLKLPISGVFASNAKKNLSGSKKEILLVEKFGKNGFDYIGNAHVDLKVWRSSKLSYIISNCGHLKRQLHRLKGKDMVEISSSVKSNFFQLLLRAMRPHQWSKNLLVFTPLILSHSFAFDEKLNLSMIAFIAFSLVASSVYILNDLLDIEADRVHKTKRNRPFASGQLSILVGFVSFPLLLVFAFGLSALYLPPSFNLILALYYLVTTVYSFVLKHKTLVDVFALAGLYTIRLFAGSTATGIFLSEWLIAFSIFIFLSLAVVKRYAELDEIKGTSAQKARGYYVTDLPFLLAFGVGSALISTLILTLYTQSEMVSRLYTMPERLIFVCPIILFWVSRIWLITYRGKMDADPIVFAVKDKTSYIIVLFLILVMWSAL